MFKKVMDLRTLWPLSKIDFVIYSKEIFKRYINLEHMASKLFVNDMFGCIGRFSYINRLCSYDNSFSNTMVLVKILDGIKILGLDGISCHGYPEQMIIGMTNDINMLNMIM